MSVEKKEFIGKTVADAIKQACDTLHAPQENLEIEVVETGSTGIFGFIRKKAKIKARIKGTVVTPAEPEKPAPQKRTPPAKPKPEPAPTAKEDLVSRAQGMAQEQPTAPVAENRAVDISREETLPAEAASVDDDEDESPAAAPASDEPLSQESIDIVNHELTQLLQLMGIPSKVEIEAQGSSLRCHVSGDFEEEITGQEGKTLDSLQYLLRKITAKKITERVRISIDAGDFKEKRQDELEDLARELAVLVKGDGKTQIIPSLNPSERRVVHMALQDDKEIRSRSVGEGLFKKVLIYKPGKPKSGSSGSGGGEKSGGTTPKKRGSSRGRRGKGNKPTPEAPEAPETPEQE
jgi:spoIIIJ-associated protein